MEEVRKNTLKRDNRIGMKGMKFKEESQIEHAGTTEQTITEGYEGQLQLRDRRRTRIRNRERRRGNLEAGAGNGRKGLVYEEQNEERADKKVAEMKNE